MNLVVKTESDCDEVYSDDNLMKQHPFINIVNTKLKQERDDFYCNVSGEESCCDSHPNDYSTDDSDSDKSDCDNEDPIESSKEEDISSVQVKAEKDDGGVVFQFIKQEPFDKKEDKHTAYDDLSQRDGAPFDGCFDGSPTCTRASVFDAQQVRFHLS